MRRIKTRRFVSISVQEYGELLQDRVELFRLRAAGQSAGAPAPELRSTFKFRFDQEVVEFLKDGLKGKTIRALHSAAVARFGVGRAPSRSAIARFALKLRRIYLPRRDRRRR